MVGCNCMHTKKDFKLVRYGDAIVTLLALHLSVMKSLKTFNKTLVFEILD